MQIAIRPHFEAQIHSAWDVGFDGRAEFYGLRRLFGLAG
jgi:hypothetical protein